jgi:hypothetical protein
MKTIHFIWISVFAALFLQGCITAKDQAPYAHQSCKDLQNYVRANQRVQRYDRHYETSLYTTQFDGNKTNNLDAILNQTQNKQKKAAIAARRAYRAKCKK